MKDRTHQLDKLQDALQDRGNKPVATFEQVVNVSGRGGRVEHWAGPKGNRLIHVGLEHGIVSSVEVYAPLVQSSRLADTLAAL